MDRTAGMGNAYLISSSHQDRFGLNRKKNQFLKIIYAPCLPGVEVFGTQDIPLINITCYYLTFQKVSGNISAMQVWD